MKEQDLITNLQPGSDPLGDLDFEKLLRVLRKSLIWIAVIFALINTATFLWIRYTKPVYKSTAELKLDIKSEANILGISSIQGDEGTNKLSGEIELLKSDLFISRLREATGLKVSYFNEGKFLSEEQYTNSPIVVKTPESGNPLYDHKIYFKPTGSEDFILSYTLGDREYSVKGKYDIPIKSREIDLTISKARLATSDAIYQPFFFIINSKSAINRFLKRNFSVVVKNINAKILEVGFTDKNKYKARDVVAAVDTLYAKYTKESKNLAIDQQIAFLDNQLQEASRNIGDYERYFENFIIDNKTINLGQDLGAAIDKLNGIDSTRFRLKEQLDQTKKLKKLITEESSIEGVIIPFSNLPKSILDKVNEYFAAEKKYNDLLRSYNESTLAATKVREEKAKTTSEVTQLLNEFQFQLKQRLDEATRNQRLIESEFSKLPSMQTSFQKNRRFYSMQEEVYFDMLAKKSELEITKAGTVANLIVLSSASLGGKPVAPNTSIIYAGGLIASFIISLLFVAIRYLMNNTISSRTELERLINTPLVGVVPLYKKEKLPVTRLVINKNPKSALSESLRSLRTNLEFFSNDSAKRVISVTSTLSGEGKTFVSVNLGAIIALSKLKVVIVDLDMRKPKVHLAFEDENEFEGVSTVLSGRTSLDDVITPSQEVENLYYIKAGTTPPNPSELMYSQDFKNMLAELKSKFDVVIFDTPPIGLVTDGILAMKKSDTALYVFKADYSKRSFVKSFNQAIKQNDFKNIGVILNGLDMANGGAYGYAYGYGYGYGYYED